VPPVHDHEVHDAVKSSKAKPYGCSNGNAPSGGYYVKARQYRADGTYYMYDHFISHVLSTHCRYDKRPTDPRCGECELHSDVEYLKGYGL
jgi:hypothetical protein